MFFLLLLAACTLIPSGAAAGDPPPETWNLSFKSDISFSQAGVSAKITASGKASLKIGENGVLTGNGKMTASERTTGPGLSSHVSGSGPFSVVGKRDGKRLIFRFTGKAFPLKGTIKAGGMELEHDSTFEPSLPVSVDSVIERKEGATTTLKNSVAGMKSVTEVALSNGANVKKEAPEPAGTFPDKANIWSLEMDARWTTGTLHGSITNTMKGRAEFPLPKEDGPARGEGPLTLKNSTMTVKGKLILDGRIENGVLRFTPRIAMQSGDIKSSGGPVTAKYGAGLWGDDGEVIAIAVEDGAESKDSFTHKASRSSGTTVWTLTGDVQPELVKFEVKGARRDGIVKPKNWAAVKDGGGEVIVTAVTKPNNRKTWKKIKWSGDTGDPVPGSPNKRRFSRAGSRKFHLEAKLGDTKDHVDLWILWAKVTVLCEKSETIPKNAPRYTALAAVMGKPAFDGTDKLGEVTWNSGAMGAGKTAHIGQITPKGAHSVVKGKWEFRRKKKGYRLGNKAPVESWPKWTDDTSKAPCLKLEPDSDDCIYDIDAPTIGGASHHDTNSAFINFRQYVLWNGEPCSKHAFWSFEAEWDFMKDPNVIYIDVAKGMKVKTP